MAVSEVTEEMVQVFDTVDDGETDKSLIENAGDHRALNAKKLGESDEERRRRRQKRWKREKNCLEGSTR